MLKTKFHLRKNYEVMLISLRKQCNTPYTKDVKSLSNYSLLNAINVLLIKNDCQPLSEEELELSLI